MTRTFKMDHSDSKEVILPELHIEPRSRYRRPILICCSFVLFVVFFLFFIDLIAFPLIVYNSASMRERLVFPSDLGFGSASDYSNPEDFGLKNAYNIKLETADNVYLGVWCIPSANSTILFNNSAAVMIFCHGSQETRASPYYIEKYKLFTSLGVDVITFDYRGYADSSPRQATVPGVVIDTLTVYDHVRKYVKPEKIILWGHSLGSNIAMEVLKRIDDDVPIVLEAPSTTTGNAIYNNYLATPLRMIPNMKPYYVDPIDMDPNTSLDSLATAQEINSTKPVLIFAAEDDVYYPPKLSEELYNAFGNSEEDSNVQFKLFDESLGLGNTDMHKSDEYTEMIQRFIISALDDLNDSPSMEDSDLYDMFSQTQ